MTVQDDRLRHGGGSAHKIPDHFVIVFHREGHHPVASVLVQVFLRILIHDVRVQGQHGDVTLMVLVQLAEVWQFLYTWPAVSGPEVNKYRLAAVVGQVELASVQAGDREVLELLPNLAADRRIARPVCRSRFRCSCLRVCGNSLTGGRFLLFDVGVKEVIVDQRRTEDRQRNPPGDLSELFAFCLGIGPVIRAAACRRLQGDVSGLQADRLLIAHLHAFGTVDAFVVTHMPHVHAAVAYAGAAVIAAGGVHLHAHNRHLAEEAVNGAKRADKTAETAIAENARKTDHQHDDKFAREQDVQHAEIACICWIGEQEDRPFKGAGRTDVLAEARHRYSVGNPVPGGDPDGKDAEDHIFQV